MENFTKLSRSMYSLLRDRDDYVASDDKTECSSKLYQNLPSYQLNLSVTVGNGILHSLQILLVQQTKMYRKK